MPAIQPLEPERTGTLMLHLLGKCNLTCAHCYMEGSPSRRERLELRDVLAAIDDCAALGVGTLYLTGGEPLMYPGLSKALERAAAVPNLNRTLCTNATLLTERHVAQLAACDFSLNVSIDGDPAYHDEFRGKKGAFRSSEAGLRLAVAAGVPVTVVMTVTATNLAYVASAAEWALGAGIGEIRFQPLLPLGRGVEIAPERLTAEETNRLVIAVSDLANRHRGRLVCKIVGQSRKFMLAHPCSAYVCNGAGCHRRIQKEIKKIVVRESGVVLPEATNLDPRFAIGRLSEGRLTMLVSRFLDHDYARFDALSRKTYADVLPYWKSEVVPWDQILADASHNSAEAEDQPAAASAACGSVLPDLANRSAAGLLI